MTRKNFKLKNDQEITAYLKKNKLAAQKSDSGLYYVISNEGEGSIPNENSNVTIGYIGYLTNGHCFDQSEKLEINLADVINGWTEGLQYFKEGDEGVLLIPAHLGYGNTDYGSIPGGSVLIFDIYLQKVD